MTYVNPYIKYGLTGIDTNLKILLNLPSPPDPKMVVPADIKSNFDGIPDPSLNFKLTLNTVPSDTDSFTSTHAAFIDLQASFISRSLPIDTFVTSSETTQSSGEQAPPNFLASAAEPSASTSTSGY